MNEFAKTIDGDYALAGNTIGVGSGMVVEQSRDPGRTLLWHHIHPLLKLIAQSL